MSKNKTLIGYIVALSLVCGLMMIPGVAYSDSLIAASSISQSEKAHQIKIEKQLKIIKEKNKISKDTWKYLKVWKTYLSKKQKQQLKNNKNKAMNSFSLTKIKNYQKKNLTIIEKAKKVKKNRDNVKKYIKKILSKDFLNDKEKNTLQKYLKKIKKSYSVKKIKKYKQKAKKIFVKAKERAVEEERYIPGMDTSGWSDAAIEYVKEWGRKNNTFLSGTPMEGLGYWIAAGAWDYNVDPAVLSSIAYIESGCGVAPYGSPYNAYGWIWNPPYMSSWEDGIYKWYEFFGQYFGGDIPVSSMHGYGGYGVETLYPYLEQIRNA